MNSDENNEEKMAALGTTATISAAGAGVGAAIAAAAGVAFAVPVAIGAGTACLIYGGIKWYKQK